MFTCLEDSLSDVHQTCMLNVVPKTSVNTTECFANIWPPMPTRAVCLSSMERYSHCEHSLLSRPSWLGQLCKQRSDCSGRPRARLNRVAKHEGLFQLVCGLFFDKLFILNYIYIYKLFSIKLLKQLAAHTKTFKMFSSVKIWRVYGI